MCHYGAVVVISKQHQGIHKSMPDAMMKNSIVSSSTSMDCQSVMQVTKNVSPHPS